MYSKMSIKLVYYLLAFLQGKYIINCDTMTTKTLQKIGRKQKNLQVSSPLPYNIIIYVKKSKGGGGGGEHARRLANHYICV